MKHSTKITKTKIETLSNCRYKHTYLFDILKPVSDVIETLQITDVVEEQNTHCSSVIRGGQRSEPFLSGGVPNLQFYGHPIQIYDFLLEVYAYVFKFNFNNFFLGEIYHTQIDLDNIFHVKSHITTKKLTNGGYVGLVIPFVAETMHYASFANVRIPQNQDFVRRSEIERHFYLFSDRYRG